MEPPFIARVDFSIKITNVSIYLIAANPGVKSGTCKGDSGGPLMKFEFLNGETIMVQTGVLHGALESCVNAEFPAIFNRISSTVTYNWILDNVFNTGKRRKSYLF